MFINTIVSFHYKHSRWASHLQQTKFVDEIKKKCPTKFSGNVGGSQADHLSLNLFR